MIILGFILLVLTGIKVYNQLTSDKLPPKDPNVWLKKYNDVDKSKPYKAD